MASVCAQQFLKDQLVILGEVPLPTWTHVRRGQLCGSSGLLS